MGTEHRSDPGLIQACLDGDEAAWGAIVERYGRLVYSIPRRYGMGEADADDVFQSVFSILVRRLETLEDRTRLSSWLITTTHRECWRRGKRQPKGLELDERDLSPAEPAEHLLERWEAQHAVREALARLGDPCRSLLEALFLRPVDRPYEAIAEELGMKVGSIGPTRARCFKKMERILREIGFEPERALAGAKGPGRGNGSG